MAIVPIVALLLLALYLWMRVPPRALLMLAIILVVPAFLSVGIAHVLGLHEALVVSPVAGMATILIVIGASRWRAKTLDTSKQR
jgi:hypothetical protein